MSWELFSSKITKFSLPARLHGWCWHADKECVNYLIHSESKKGSHEKILNKLPGNAIS